jgi:predicted transposase YbfD/YdcC
MHMNGGMGLKEHFANLPDPRMVKKCDHQLLDIVVIAICAVVAGAESWDEIALFGEAKEEWLKGWLELPNGIPSADTFRRVFELVDANAFQGCFIAWVQGVFQQTDGQVIAIDGKTVRGTCDKTGKPSLHVVSAWATANALSLGEVRVKDKSNEITAIPTLLDLLMLKGCIVTLDAIGCQKTILENIRTKEADYIVTVKGNHPTLHRHLLTAFARQDEAGFPLFSPDYCQTRDEQHGRIETRQCWVLGDGQAQVLGWRDAQSLVRVTRTIEYPNKPTQVETHYYLTSLPPLASLILASIRSHWAIENSCHWVLDVIFREDQSRTRSRFADDNLSILRKIALNLLRQHPARGSLKGKRFRAGLNERFLAEVLRS